MMKKLNLTIIWFLLAGFLQAQENPQIKTDIPPSKIPKNELGLDMSTFVKYYLNFQGGTGYASRTPYMLTYRHYGLNRNIRAAISFAFEASDSPSPVYGETKRYHKQQSDIMARYGFEWYQELSRRWQLYYGADLRSSYAYLKNESQFYNAGYINAYEGATMAIGISPILGFRFRLNDRLSILTESNFLIQYTSYWQMRSYTPSSSLYPALAPEKKSIVNSIGTSFSLPTMLVLAVSL